MGAQSRARYKQWLSVGENDPCELEGDVYLSVQGGMSVCENHISPTLH